MNLGFVDFSDLTKDNTLSFMDKKKSASLYHLVSTFSILLWW